MTNNTQTADEDEFDYKDYLKRKLQPHPVGRSTDELEKSLPPDTSEDMLADAIEALSDRGTIQQIGGKWRWRQFN